jgi:hypothetical protein
MDWLTSGIPVYQLDLVLSLSSSEGGSIAQFRTQAEFSVCLFLDSASIQHIRRASPMIGSVQVWRMLRYPPRLKVNAEH